MADGIVENVFLVNAPAGSGKTTWIRSEIEKYLLTNPYNNILCITYTNRAADELGRDLDTERVFIGTIHNFFNKFISSFFTHTDIIDLYCEIYEDRIKERIDNVENKEEWTNSNERYKEKYGEINLETVRKHFKKISYGETSFTSLYRGALSHDDLLTFSKCAIDRFPVIKKKISDKYQVIFIDEYQDTSSDVLQIFFDAVVGKNCKLYLLGDKMQQIYNNYNGAFEIILNRLNRSIRLSTNYRTTPKIVEILNSIYNDENLKQSSYEKNKDSDMLFYPKVIFSSNTEEEVSRFCNKYDDALVLFLSNKSRFDSIGIGNLYSSYSKMKKYAFGSKYTVVDVFIKEDSRSNDALLSFLFMVNQIVTDYRNGKYGEIFRKFNKYKACFNSEKFICKKHSDKQVVKEKIELIKNLFSSSTISIDEFLLECYKNQFINEEYYFQIVEDDDYHHVENVFLIEIKMLADYLNKPKVSTQHGVKGESHDTVLFVAENGINPAVYMSEFFKLWSKTDISLLEFDDFYYKYKAMLEELDKEVGTKCSTMKKKDYEFAKNIIEDKLKSFRSYFKNNKYYIHLLEDSFEKYFCSSTVTNVKNCLKLNKVYGPLCAYRLFYVGCSRARKNLAIIIKKEDVIDFEQNLRKKFNEIGFETK